MDGFLMVVSKNRRLVRLNLAKAAFVDAFFCNVKFWFVLIGLMAPEPEFVEPLQNVTVTAGRDIKLQCSVKHLASFKVLFSSFSPSFHFCSFDYLLFNYLTVRYWKAEPLLAFKSLCITYLLPLSSINSSLFQSNLIENILLFQIHI